MPRFLTTKQVGELIGKPEWLVRRVVDSLGPIERFGQKRMIPVEMVERIRAEIAEREGATA
jgi:hypothetical protein